jgi:type I restriction enzyme, R subunit
MELLKTAIKKYQNKVLTATEVIGEPIQISTKIVASDAEAQTMGLSDY